VNPDRTRILVVDDEEIVRESLGGWLEKDGYTLGTAPDGPSALKAMREEKWSILLVDLKMPGMDGLQVLEEARRLSPDTEVVIMTAYATVDTAVQAMKNGAWDYLVKPFDPEELSLLIQKIVARQALVRENTMLRRALRREYGFKELTSRNPAMQGVLDLAKTAARSHSTILILGESGTGKEVLARAVHSESPRAQGPFVAVSCAALAETLLESELFGHEKGSFTGATARRRGKFEAADKGTLFLDEVGDIGPKLQLDLLRALEDRRFFRVGGSEPVTVDARIVAATNRDLKKAVENGDFREDLYYRLNVIPVRLAPLRERREDIPTLVDRFLEQLSLEMEKRLEGLTDEAMEVLKAHDWPGNVRELRNVLERGAVVCTGALIQASDLGLISDTGTPTAAAAVPNGAPASLEHVEREHISSVLAFANGNVSQAARILGIDRATLYAKIRRYGLRRGGEGEEPAA